MILLSTNNPTGHCYVETANLVNIKQKIAAKKVNPYRAGLKVGARFDEFCS